MAQLRPMLLMGLVVLAYLMWVEWQKDYGVQPQPQPQPQPGWEQPAQPQPQPGAQPPAYGQPPPPALAKS